jgi:hypothetical protein
MFGRGVVIYMKNRLQASYTIEAALIFPLVLGTMVAAILGGIELYGDVKETASACEADADPDAVSIFYILKGLEGVVNSGD